MRNTLRRYAPILGPSIIRDNDALKKEIELLESLSDMKETAAMLKNGLKDDGGIHALDRQFQGLGMNEMAPLDHKSPEFTEIGDYLNNSKGQTHNVDYKVQEIFRIERKGEFERFEKSKYAKIASNRRLLWHGSRVTNYGGILAQGLRIAPPEAPVSGYMFGKGIYLADMSSKSANYCCSYNSGGTALLLLCEAELGNPMHQLTDSSYSAGEDALKKGMYSTFGMGQTGPSKWKDAACINPALAGCMMVSTSTAYCHHVSSQANYSSLTCRHHLVLRMFPGRTYNTMSISRTTSPRSSSATYFASACSIILM
jgi:poly [ADP-ribose] polymerase